MKARTVLGDRSNLVQSGVSCSSKRSQRKALLQDIRRAQEVLDSLAFTAQKSQSRKMDALVEMKGRYQRVVEVLLQQNSRLKAKLAGEQVQASLSPSQPELCQFNEGGDSSESNICYSQCELRLDAVACPEQLLCHFETVPRCREVPCEGDCRARGAALGLFKFIALTKADSLLQPILSIIGQSEMRLDAFQQSSIPEEYRYFYEDTILKAVLNCYLKQVLCTEGEAGFYNLIIENPVFQFVGTLMVKALCLTDSQANSYHQAVSTAKLVNTLGEVFELRIQCDNRQFYRFYGGGGGSWSMLLGERVLLFEAYTK